MLPAFLCLKNYETELTVKRERQSLPLSIFVNPSLDLYFYTEFSWYIPNLGWILNINFGKKEMEITDADFCELADRSHF